LVWQAILRNWLQQQAKAKFYDSVADAQRQRSAGAQADALPEPCDVGLVFALGIEQGGLEDLLHDVITIKGSDFIARQGRLKGRNVVLIEAGVGPLAAARGTQALLAGHRPAWVISAGFSGALDPKLKQGDIIMADSIADGEGHRLSIDFKISPEAAAATPGLHVGRLLTVDHIVRLPEEKRALGEQHEALAVDMESWAVGEVCRQAKTRFMAVRIVSDAVDDELPAEIERLAKQKTQAARLGAAAGAIFRRPSSIKDMLKLKEDALIASDKLAKFLTGVVTQLAPARSESWHDSEVGIRKSESKETGERGASAP
jgi:adenosylhomocysteine nucleosidase